MHLYPRDIDAELLHVRSIDNRALNTVVDLEEAVAELVVGVVWAGHLGALEVEHVVVRPILGPVPLAWVLELGS